MLSFIFDLQVRLIHEAHRINIQKVITVLSEVLVVHKLFFLEAQLLADRLLIVQHHGHNVFLVGLIIHWFFFDDEVSPVGT